MQVLLEWYRILKPGGLLFISLPNAKANEYDFVRQVPEISHLLEDFYGKNNDITSEHFEEFLTIICALDPGTKEYNEARIDFLRKDFRPHYHVYDINLVRAMLAKFWQLCGKRFRLLHLWNFHFGYEIIFNIAENCGREQ